MNGYDANNCSTADGGLRPKADLICSNIDDGLACGLDCKPVINIMNQDDRLAYFVVVHGMDVQTFEQMAIHFACRRGGMRALDESRYISIPVTLDAIGRTLTWVKTELDGCYRELYLIVSVEAKLSWSEVVIPAEIALLAGQSKAAIKVLLSN